MSDHIVRFRVGDHVFYLEHMGRNERGNPLVEVDGMTLPASVALQLFIERAGLKFDDDYMFYMLISPDEDDLREHGVDPATVEVGKIPVELR